MHVRMYIYMCVRGIQKYILQGERLKEVGKGGGNGLGNTESRRFDINADNVFSATRANEPARRFLNTLNIV